MCVCVRACVCVCVCVHVRACVRVRACGCMSFAYLSRLWFVFLVELCVFLFLPIMSSDAFNAFYVIKYGALVRTH